MAAFNELHVGRSWDGHWIEDTCDCPQHPCGLVTAEMGCPEHGFDAAKTIRQLHTAANCPGVPQ